MKYFLIVSIFILSNCLFINGQTPAGKSIFEVHESRFGMVSEPGNFLFVRVYDNGQVEFEEPIIKNNERKFELRQYNLSLQKVKDLTDFLNKTAVQNIATEYTPDIPIIDHYVGLKITINRAADSQTIKLQNFAPTFPRLEDKYPSELVELVCFSRALRYNKDF